MNNQKNNTDGAQKKHMIRPETPGDTRRRPETSLVAIAVHNPHPLPRSTRCSPSARGGPYILGKHGLPLLLRRLPGVLHPLQHEKGGFPVSAPPPPPGVPTRFKPRRSDRHPCWGGTVKQDVHARRVPRQSAQILAQKKGSAEPQRYPKTHTPRIGGHPRRGSG